MQKIVEQGSLAHVDGIPEDIRRVFVCAHDVSPIWFTTHDDVFFLVPFFSPERTRKVIMIIIYISQRAWRPSNHVK